MKTNYNKSLIITLAIGLLIAGLVRVTYQVGYQRGREDQYSFDRNRLSEIVFRQLTNCQNDPKDTLFILESPADYMGNSSTTLTVYIPCSAVIYK